MSNHVAMTTAVIILHLGLFLIGAESLSAQILSGRGYDRTLEWDDPATRPAFPVLRGHAGDGSRWLNLLAGEPANHPRAAATLVVFTSVECED